MAIRRLPILLLLTVVATATSHADDRAERARSLAQAGDLAGALAIYDSLMTPSLEDRSVAHDAIGAAYRAKDARRYIVYAETWLKRDPSEFPVRRLLPGAYMAIGNRAGAGQARTAVMAAWPQAKPLVPKEQTSFEIDRFSVGTHQVVARQCYEGAGRFGVRFRFDVVDDGHLTSFITLESSDLENQIAREMSRLKPGERIASVDVYLPGEHRTTAMLRAIPDYDHAKALVIDYLRDGKYGSASRNGQPGFMAVDCEVAR